VPCIGPFAFVLPLLSHGSGRAVPEHPVGSQCGSHGVIECMGALCESLSCPVTLYTAGPMDASFVNDPSRRVPDLAAQRKLPAAAGSDILGLLD
jgi:hypothetical protein